MDLFAIAFAALANVPLLLESIPYQEIFNESIIWLSNHLNAIQLVGVYSWEKRAMNTIANFGKAGKAIINNIHIYSRGAMSICCYLVQTTIGRPSRWTFKNPSGWTTLVECRGLVNSRSYNSLQAKHQSKRQSLRSFLSTHLDDEINNLVKVHAHYE